MKNNSNIDYQVSIIIIIIIIIIISKWNMSVFGPPVLYLQQWTTSCMQYHSSIIQIRTYPV
jgi:hypothetical protein